MDPADAASLLQEFILFVKHQRTIVDYAQVSAFALFYYDFLITLHLEIQLVWRSAWSYTKILFLLSRYIVAVLGYFVFYNQVFLDVGADGCQWASRVEAWLLAAGLGFSEIVLAIRTWAVWNRSRWIGSFLAVCVSVHITLNAIIIKRYLDGMIVADGPYRGYRGCFILNDSNILYISFISLAIMEATIVILMGISAWKSYRVDDRNQLSHVIHRDGILFYVYLMILALANLVIILVLPLDFEWVLAPLQSVLYSVFTCRIILNIRGAGKYTTAGSQHVGVGESVGTISRLKFGETTGEGEEEIEMF